MIEKKNKTSMFLKYVLLRSLLLFFNMEKNTSNTKEYEIY